MTKTTNYQLPQWEAEDPVKREDFNDAMAKIDAGIATAGHVVGTYSGNGAAMGDGGQFINLGFKPRFVIISRGWSGNSPNSNFLAAGITKASGVSDYFTIETNGFRVGIGSTGTLNVNTSSYTYTYIAFR